MRVGRICTAVVAAGLSMTAAQATAAAIAVVNPSFEATPPGGYPLTAGCQGAGCSYSEGGGEIPGWTNSFFAGEFIPGPQVGNFLIFNYVPDGTNVAFANTATISQTVGATVIPGTTYTLTVDLGWRKDMPTFTGMAELVIDGTPYVASGVAPVQGDWSAYTATYVGTAADAGAPITIELNSTGNFEQQADFDNVQLTGTAASGVPEPASWSAMLLGFGLTAAALRIARRRSRLVRKAA